MYLILILRSFTKNPATVQRAWIFPIKRLIQEAGRRLLIWGMRPVEFVSREIVILLGGVKRIGQVAEMLVTFMALVYIVLALGVIVLNYRNIPGVFAAIFEGAFNPASITGGAVGSFFMKFTHLS